MDCKEAQADRKQGLPQGHVKFEGLLRGPCRKIVFIPTNKAKTRTFFTPEFQRMANTGGERFWIEKTIGASRLSLVPLKCNEDLMIF